MSLLPIIYTSLIIFSSVLFVVLIVSYIAYKYKQSEQVAYAGINNSSISEHSLQNRDSKLNSLSHSYTRNLESNKVSNRINDQLSQYPAVNSNYFKDQRKIGKSKIDVIYREKSPTYTANNTHVRRMTVVEDISKNSMPTNNYNQHNANRSLEFSNNTGRNILRYYDDF